MIAVLAVVAAVLALPAALAARRPLVRACALAALVAWTVVAVVAW